MKDYRHLFGGMIGGLTLLAAYISGWGMLQKCSGMEISRPAGDGVNTVTLEVDERGNVMSERSTAVYVPQRYIPQSGDRVAVGDFDYIMVSVADWGRLTNAVARLEAVAERRWTKEHQTEAGRRAWHGAATNRVVSADGRSVTWLYADGYAYTEQAEAVRRAPPAVRRMRQREAPRPARPNMPRMLREKQEAMAARPKAKEVNATFGPGGRVIKAEGGK
jgi:hypothetical protein